MALSNPKIFGLNVLSSFADVRDKTQALTTLNLPPLDLRVIDGSSTTANRQDWISLSRLNSPIFSTLSKYRGESSTLLSQIGNKSGSNGILFGGLNINGRLSGNAIRYRYLDGTGPSATVKIADISTSRASSWSSSSSPVLNTSPIFYGARVGIITGGQLEFGTPTNSNQIRLQTTQTPEIKEFPSEFPTSKIQCNIGGTTVTLYAMKGIPLVFKGFFRDLDATITLTSLINNTPASWKIVEVNNESKFSNFTNAGNTIRFRSVSSRQRYIKYYYNPNNILTITINFANIGSLPETKLINATTINFSYNNLRNFPDFTFISPNIRRLFLIRNPFSLSENQNERKLNQNIVNKIPSGLQELYLGETFNGSINQNLIANNLPNLKVLDLSRNGSARFTVDSENPTNPLPNVSDECEVYNLNNNDFRAFGTTNVALNQYNIKDLPNLVSLQIYGNFSLVDTSFSIASQKIISVNLGGTGLSCPNLANRQELQSHNQDNARNAGSLLDSGTYKFDNCSKLSSLSFRNSNVTGAIPTFTNPELNYLDLRNTGLTGGSQNGNTSHVIPANTFEQCAKLRFIFLESGNFLTSPIHPDAFVPTTSLSLLWYRSFGRTSGPIPTLSTCSQLSYLYLYDNKFTGSMPNFASNPSIGYIQLAYNSLTGVIPGLRNLSNLRELYLNNNQFIGLSRFTNLPTLRFFHAHNNQISGDIPDFSQCPRMDYLILYNNQFTGYTPGSFSTLYYLRYLDLSRNNLTQQTINQIISDLLTNYNSVKRGGVTINLRLNSPPSGQETLDAIQFLRSKRWSITHD
jgi:hypothetical protein